MVLQIIYAHHSFPKVALAKTKWAWLSEAMELANEGSRLNFHVTVVPTHDLGTDCAIGAEDAPSPTAFVVQPTDYNIEHYDEIHLETARNNPGMIVAKKSHAHTNFESVFPSRPPSV